MLSPSFPYATIATAAAGVTVADTSTGLSWTEGTIAGAVIVVSLFWIRRADAEARRDRAEMRQVLHRQNRQIAALVKGYADANVPLPDVYLSILDDQAKE